MVKHADIDEPDSGPPRRGRAARPVVLQEFSEEPLASKRNDLVVEIRELEGCLNYMGSAHPQRDPTRARLASLKALLIRWDRALAIQKAQQTG
jgi:hypothetical protein